jgi:signal transduction histidine kinase
VATTPGHQPTLEATLARALSLLDRSRLGAAIDDEARAGARRTAQALFAACGGEESAVAAVAAGFAAELLGAVAVDLAADPPEARRLTSRLAAEIDVPAAVLAREVLRAGGLLELPVEIALETTLSLLRAFCDATAASLWTGEGSGRPRLASHAGEPGGAAAEVALGLLDEGRAHRGPRVHAVRIETSRFPAAALVVEGPAVDDAIAAALVPATAPLLATLLARQDPLDAPEAPDEMAGAVQRRLARLRFDLHDGPQQDIHLLAQDLRLFREQLRPMIAGDPNESRALGRLDDLEAQLVALDGDLRRLATSVQSPFLAPGSLAESLRQITDAFAGRSGVVPEVRLEGPVATMTDSQQIAVLSLIREALANIRQHSDATQVAIVIIAGPDGVRTEISDNGRGFDPERTLVRAARAGRLGLVGMHERVRMLGGATKIESRAGGPTVISATLPPFMPD